MEFNKDINGLRAIAVASVMLYHMSVRPFSGGFVGVDIFFVISGFLMTSLTLEELNRASFSASRFLTKRLKRIFPILAVVSVAIMAWAGYFYLSGDYKHLVRIATMALTFSSNFAFASDVGYFQPEARTSFFLHTWSLSVEAQFYLTFAVANRFFWPRGTPTQRKIGTTLFFVALVLSLAWCIHQTALSQKTAFYLFPSRAWEFLVGAMIAAYGRNPSSPFKRIALQIAGTTLLAWSIFGLTADTSFPGWYALLPVAGTALLILASVAGTPSILGCMPFQFLGRISYSVYLWHWPLLLAFREKMGAEPNASEIALLVAGSIALGWVTFLFVETPTRRHWSMRGTVVAAAGTIAGAYAFLTVVSWTHGLPRRLPDYQQPAVQAMRNPNPLTAQCCRDVDGTKRTPGEFCSIGTSTEHPATIILWGDSFADRLHPVVSDAASLAGIKGIVATQGGCPPFSGEVFKGSGAEIFSGCERYANFVFDYFKQHPEITVAVVAADWQRYSAEYEGVVLNQIASILAKRSGHLILVAMVPNPHADVPHEWARLQFRAGKAIPEWTFPLTSQASLINHWNRMSEAVRQANNVIIVDPFKVLCDNQECYRVKDNCAWFSDTDHLSSTGVGQLTPLISKAIHDVASEQNFVSR